MHRALIHELATVRFIAQREDALFLGPPGTGKSHLAQAIGRAANQQGGYRVLYAGRGRPRQQVTSVPLDPSRLSERQCQTNRETACSRRRT